VGPVPHFTRVQLSPHSSYNPLHPHSDLVAASIPKCCRISLSGLYCVLQCDQPTVLTACLCWDRLAEMSVGVGVVVL